MTGILWSWLVSVRLKSNNKLRTCVRDYVSPVKRICVFEHSVMTNFNCACPAVQRGQGSGVLSESSSWFTACMSEQRRFWRDCADAQARLNLRCSHRRWVPNSLDAVHVWNFDIQLACSQGRYSWLFSSLCKLCHLYMSLKPGPTCWGIRVYPWFTAFIYPLYGLSSWCGWRDWKSKSCLRAYPLLKTHPVSKAMVLLCFVRNQIMIHTGLGVLFTKSLTIFDALDSNRLCDNGLIFNPIKIIVDVACFGSSMGQVMRKSVLCHMRTTKVQISLRIRAAWSAPLLFAA